MTSPDRDVKLKSAVNLAQPLNLCTIVKKTVNMDEAVFYIDTSV